jgi:hypothetical protein
MEYRAPSSLAAADAVVRRRSGVYLQHDDGTEGQLNTPAGDLQRRTTILLVRRTLSSPLLPALPRFSSRSPSPPLSAWAYPADTSEPSEPEQSFTPVLLTPRPDGPQHASCQSITSTASTTPSLPTPDFTQPPRFLSLFHRGLSSYPAPRPFCSRASASESQFPDIEYRPQSVRSDSQGSSSGSSTDSGSNSIDSGNHALIKSIGTTDKFTHKWPRPRSLRTCSADDVIDAASLTFLEDGRGLGMDSAEPWTGFKWCLLLSVCTVFAYGGAALLCALMTWFRSKLLSS